MKFKRCSVDGLVFGAPVLKNDGPAHGFHPLKKLLIGKIGISNSGDRAGLEGLGGESTFGPSSQSDKLTFNAEMFFRVMSLCHTVVVEKDYDANKGFIDASKSSRSNVDAEKGSTGGALTGFLGFGKKNTTSSGNIEYDHFNPKEMEEGPSEPKVPVNPDGKGKDGAPSGR